MPHPLEHALLQAYYGTPWTDDTSSHWREYGDRFQIAIDPAGNLRPRGYGFGACRWQGVGHGLFDVATSLAHLTHLDGRRRILALLAVARRLVRAAGLHPTFDVLRQVCTCALLERYIGAYAASERIVIIGDGYGVLAALMKAVYPRSRVALVDLGRTLLFQVHHVRRAHPHATHVLAGAGGALEAADFVYCPSDRIEALAGLRFDIAINVASMQEMAPPTVTAYFAFLRSHLVDRNLFYCCNRERKELVGGEVSEFAAYPWRAGDQVLVDGPCPWHQYFLARRRVRRGARVLGLPVPFVRHYDGPQRHRLAVLERA
jgi:hypothetical protein